MVYYEQGTKKTVTMKNLSLYLVMAQILLLWLITQLQTILLWCYLLQALHRSLYHQAVMLSNKLSSLSSRLGLPKAKKRLQSTDGAIVHAPGHSTDAKMVISRFGKCPHLVPPKKKSGGLTCDDDCPQYKSAKLCSHNVAAATTWPIHHILWQC